MTHFVCLECKGLSDKPGVCQTEECPRQEFPLSECSCTDGEHLTAILPEEEEKDEIAK